MQENSTTNSLGANWVGHGTSILRKLASSQHSHVFDALHSMRVHVPTKFLVAEHSQSFLQSELEPVSAGDTVSCPVVEVFMADLWGSTNKV